MMFSKKRLPLWRGLTAVFVALFTFIVIGSGIAEANIGTVDEALGTKSFTVVTEKTEGEDLYTYKSDYKTAKEMVDKNKTFAENVEANGAVLLKNTNKALPLKATEKKVTLVGKAAYSNVFGGQMGSSVADNSKYAGYEKVTLSAALEADGFEINQRMSAAYFLDTKIDSDFFGNPKPGAVPYPAYRDVSTLSGSFGAVKEADKANYTFNINEVGLNELEAKDPGVTSTFGDYKTAIVVLGRINSEGRDYLPGEAGLKLIGAGEVNEGAKDPLGLSNRERDMIKMAKEKSDKVVVLINSNSPMEIPEVANDDGVHAILWIGTPGTYGMNGVVDILTGAVNPSGKLPDTYAYDNSVGPAAQNWGIYEYSNVDKIGTTANDVAITATKGADGKPTGIAVDAYSLAAASYIVYQEGIYLGYKYYETRYYDSLVNTGSKANSAKGARGGATSWVYKDEVLYPFGYGLSYTTFEQTLKSVSVDKAAKKVTAVVNVKNTGDVDGKEAVELYASVPYTQYDRENLIEKSAIQLLDYEKVELKKGEAKDVTIVADLTDLASYDSKQAKTYILDEGTYYFTIGNGSHEAMNNVLAAQNVSGTDKAGKASNVATWNNGGRDTTTFAQSANGTKITNQLDNADINYYQPNAVKYLTRQDWDGSFPSFKRLEANEAMIKALRSKVVEVSQDDKVGTKWAKEVNKDVKLPLGAMKGVDFDDPRWSEFLSQMTLHEALHVTAIGGNSTWVCESIQNPFAKQADGPNGYSSFGLGDQITDKNSPLYAESQGALKGYKFNNTPNAPILAATFDKKILKEYGEQLGNMSLWTGGPSIWAGGANQHRSPYEGRTHEYFSEDPILSAYMLREMIVAARKYGAIIGPKHFAFNAVEFNRCGLSEFMTEQTARETELRCFQKAFESGMCLGAMTAFNRIGVTNLNNHNGLMQNILRKEWGFKGLLSTDMASNAYYFLPVENIMGGITMMANGRGSDDHANFKAQWVYSEEDYIKNDAKINEQLKTNMHYQWYAYAQSNIMNGINASSRVTRNITWWGALLIVMEVLFGVLALGGATMYAMTTLKGKQEE